ncbi:MAG: single-stranded-DNA-specific exonuclease RecJ [Betaproteobacteria bacterium RBG_19FT_COMBO_58_11]|nr:MAG: single-stranded-DNA-specific exonuclease RecJ [Betaproteobacteria bacterium RBG_19FT_COMBO_58_11]
MTTITIRPVPQPDFERLTQHGLTPLLARIYAARGITDPQQLEAELAGLLPLTSLTNAEAMACALADAIAAKKRLLIVADYDADGATACAVGLRSLREFGATVEYLVPNRFEYGYGLTPEIVRLAADMKPDIIITVDNGIASHAGVDEAHRLGMQVFVTDHHLPAETLPDAEVIVNPNQPGCAFASKNLAGVGVMFYVMLALRAELRRRGAFADKAEPNLAKLLDIVALGTVADVVRLDDNNRILVRQGVKRIRGGQACAGIRALYQVAKRSPQRASTWDLGFTLGPRLNAAGRLTDMALGIELLSTDDEARAQAIAIKLDELNRERREIEAGMQETALAQLDKIEVGDRNALSLFDPAWHQGVIGILASRLKEKYHRPVIAFAQGNAGELKGSGRSIAGFHLRDALDLVAKRHPALLKKFGGHAMAAGVTLDEAALPQFESAFEAVAAEWLTPAQLARIIETDGSLPTIDAQLDTAQTLAHQVWGQGFPEPQFVDRFIVASQRIVGEKHTKLKLERDGAQFEAMLFFRAETLPTEIEAVYRLDVNEFNGKRSLQLILQHWETACTSPS